MNDTYRYAVGFLILLQAAVFLNLGQPRNTVTRFASTFFTLFIVIFLLNQGRLGGFYLLLALLAPELSNPAVVGPLYMLVFFILRDGRQ
ncbi:hypothetical protein EL26_03305 [Tumebacillus flagellatus]|uniref:Uncharacterized protein n=1 Tax=Tumebacillus flagellatus TaxID=1157490 RepID=A0A074LTU1_9BACL|nr:hypothetical protein EL26_03305 [Tumebacillus flagellatus]